MKQKFYITTAIAYTSRKPHIGNVYEAVLTDAIARFQRLNGRDVFFLTGTDEHGQKIEECAAQAGVSPQEYVDGVASQIRSIWDSFNISYDGFIRTTDKIHERTVQKIFKKLYEQGDIYKGTYEGPYCKPCESFWTESQLKDGCCPDCGAPVTRASEEAYYLRLSKYQDALEEYLNTHDGFIVPEARKNEMINNFIKPGLQDLCVSRSSFKWGIPVDFDEGHVIYVWIDALSNYITAIGYDPDGSSEQYKKLWPADLHVVGKDIIRFHTIYWPIMLMALGEPLPKKVLGHPWLLFNRDKMSKSKGNVIYGDELISLFGLDAVRYYLLSEMTFQNDGNISYEAVASRTNTDLANILGNLVSRTAAMIRKYFDASIPENGPQQEIDAALAADVLDCARAAVAHYESYNISDACADVISIFRHCNKYIDETMPWVLAKDESGRGRLATVLAYLVEAVRMGCALFAPIAPESAGKIARIFGFEEDELTVESLSGFSCRSAGRALGDGGAVFARIDIAELNERIAALHPAAPASASDSEKPAASEAAASRIDIDDFRKVSLVVGEVVSCESIPKSDKLLRLCVDIGSEKRQVVSGIAKSYKPEELVGKKLILVSNLKPAVLRGVESNGMILASGSDEIKVVFIDPSVPNGTPVC